MPPVSAPEVEHIGAVVRAIRPPVSYFTRFSRSTSMMVNVRMSPFGPRATPGTRSGIPHWHGGPLYVQGSVLRPRRARDDDPLARDRRLFLRYANQPRNSLEGAHRPRRPSQRP